MIAAIIQARMGSTRLPGKTLTQIEDKPLIGHVLDRVELTRHIDKIIVATTTHPEDDLLERYASTRQCLVFRGSVDDVLDRYYQAAKYYDIDSVVRITADDPFKDPHIIGEVLDLYLAAEGELDYISNTIKPTYPEGLDVEVFSFAALQRSWNEAKLAYEREHVTPYMWTHPEHFRLRNVEHTQDLSGLRWTLDTPEDLQFTRCVYAELYSGKPFFMQDILNLLRRRPEIAKLNSGHRRLEAFWTDVAEQTRN